MGELITQRGSKFHSLIVEGKNENLKQSTLVSGWVKWPLLKDGYFGIKKSSGIQTRWWIILYIMCSLARILLSRKGGRLRFDSIDVTLENLE